MATRPTIAFLAQELGAGRTTSAQLVEQCLAKIAEPAGEGGSGAAPGLRSVRCRSSSRIDSIRMTRLPARDSARRAAESTREVQH